MSPRDTTASSPRRLRSTLLLAIAALLLGACASTPVELSGGEIRNLTRSPLMNVEALHHPTGAKAATNMIPAGESLLLGFRTRELRSTSATIQWSDGFGRHVQEVHIPACPAELRGAPVWIVYSIHANGLVEVGFEAQPAQEPLFGAPAR